VKPPPTDFELLRAIYERHRADYASAPRHHKVALPIDIPAIGGDLGVDPHIVFGRLRYHLDPLYGEPEEDGKKGRKAFFMEQPGETPDRINFPMLEAVLAGLWEERRRDRRTFWIAVVSVGLALGSFVVAIVALQAS
jgi:hypothetical protein